MLLAHIYWILPIGHIIKNLNIFSQQNFWLWSSQSSGLRYSLWVHNLRVRFSRYAQNYAFFGQFFFFRSLLNSISCYYWLFMVLIVIMLVCSVYRFLYHLCWIISFTQLAISLRKLLYSFNNNAIHGDIQIRGLCHIYWLCNQWVRFWNYAASYPVFGYCLFSRPFPQSVTTYFQLFMLWILIMHVSRDDYFVLSSLSLSSNIISPNISFITLGLLLIFFGSVVHSLILIP